MEELTMRNAIHCEKCGDSGFETVMVDGEKKSRYCSCGPRRRATYYLKKSGLEGVIGKYRFDNFRADEEFQQRMLDICRRFIAQDQQRMLYLSGQTGAGKTHLGTAVCGHYLNLGKSVYYKTYQPLMNEMKCALNTEAYDELLKRYGGAEVLYIDDFMKFTPSEADLKQAFELINRRAMTDGITIITSERMIDELVAVDEALGARIRHQCGEFSFCVSRVEGRNWRLT